VITRLKGRIKIKGKYSDKTAILILMKMSMIFLGSYLQKSNRTCFATKTHYEFKGIPDCAFFLKMDINCEKLVVLGKVGWGFGYYGKINAGKLRLMEIGNLFEYNGKLMQEN